MKPTPMPYLETDNERVLLFRFRTDLKTNRALAAELRRRADELEKAFTDPLNPEMDLIDPSKVSHDNHNGIIYDRIAEVQRLVRSSTQYSVDADWKQARLIRWIVITGDCLWHASWVLFGSKDGRGCDCADCAPRASGSTRH